MLQFHYIECKVDLTKKELTSNLNRNLSCFENKRGKKEKKSNKKITEGYI